MRRCETRVPPIRRPALDCGGPVAAPRGALQPPRHRWRPAAILALLALVPTACDRPAPPSSPPPAASGEIRQLDELPTAQLRVFLKGFPGDWRGATDASRGLPEPPVETAAPPGARTVDLPAPAATAGAAPLAQAIASRRSVRRFADEPLTLAELSFLLWATQGVTGSIRDAAGNVTHQLRAAPSGGARYPLDTWLVVRRVEGLPAGVYRYQPSAHRLVVAREDPAVGASLEQACYGEPVAGAAAVTFAWTAVPRRSEWKYGPIAHKMIALEAGHACQNLYLAAGATGAAACALLGYHQPALDALLGVDGEEAFTIYLACVGKAPAGQGE